MTTAYVFEPAPMHVYRGHPEAPSRFDVLQPRLASFGARSLKSVVASRDEIRLVHTDAMIDSIEGACRKGETVIDFAPTFVTQSSFEDARRAVGASLACVRSVLDGTVGNAFAIARPPGHHAEPDRAMGFCLFNNVAIAARAALADGLDRVAIIDYDAHHGNGTEAAFIHDDHVAYLSTHQWGIYPGTGWLEGDRSARKRIVNIPLPAGSGDRAFSQIGDQIVDPFIRAFKPDLMLVSAGFDAHWSDPITSLGLSSAGFYHLSARLVDLADELCQGRIVFVLEGGYSGTNLANGAAAVFTALTHEDFRDPGDASPAGEPDIDSRLEAVKSWHGFLG